MTDEEWRRAQEQFPVGQLAAGRVMSHHRFGFFIDLGGSVVGLVETIRHKELDQPVSEADFPPIGDTIEAVVLGHTPHNRQIRMSTRPSDLAAASK